MGGHRAASNEFESARKRLRDELVYARTQWEEIQVLFGDNAERIEFLNRVANWFFGMTSRALFRDLLVRIARLCDPPKAGKSTRMSIELLLRDPRVRLRPELEAEIGKRIESLRAQAQPIIEHRHKNIAHWNRAVAVGEVRVLLPPVSPSLITEVLREMQHIYNVHGGAIYDSVQVFEFKPTHGAQHFLEIIELGDQAFRRKWDLD